MLDATPDPPVQAAADATADATFDRVFKALSSATRRSILDLLKDGPLHHR